MAEPRMSSQLALPGPRTSHHTSGTGTSRITDGSRQTDASRVTDYTGRGTNATDVAGNANGVNLFTGEDDEPIPWSMRYVLACILLPVVNGCLSKSLWPCFTLYYLSMSWPLWRCGLAISCGAFVHCLAQKMISKVGIWISLPFSLLHLIFAILALAFLEEEWAIFAEMICLLGLDTKIAIEGVAYEWFLLERECFGAQASSAVVTTLALSQVLSFSIGAIIYEFTGWQGIAIFHVSSQGLILALLAVCPPCWKSLKTFLSVKEGRLTARNLIAVLPQVDETIWEVSEAAEADESLVESAASPSHEGSVGPDKAIGPDKVAVSSVTSPDEKSDKFNVEKVQVGPAGYKASRSSMEGPAPGTLGYQQEGAWNQPVRFSPQRGSMLSQMSKPSGGRGSTASFSRGSFLASKTQRFTVLSAIKGRSTTMSNTHNDMALNPVESNYVVDPDLNLVLAERNAYGFSLEAVKFDDRFPAILVALAKWAFHFSMLSQLATFALLLARSGWTSAVWAGVVQSAGEVLCILLTIVRNHLPEPSEEDADAKRGFGSRCYNFCFVEPYNVTLYLLFFSVINFCLLIPEAAGVVTVQVLFAGTYAFSNHAVHNMYVLYSCIKNPDMMCTVTSFGYIAGAIGSIMAGVVTLSLFEISPEMPFILSGCACFLMCIQYTGGFCSRVGLDLLTAEVDRTDSEAYDAVCE